MRPRGSRHSGCCGKSGTRATKGVDLDAYFDANLIGTPDEVCAKVQVYQEAGLDHFCASLFVGNTVDELLDQMRLFARHVLPAFPSTQPPA